MPDSIAELEQRRSAITQQISQLGDFRPGSITNTTGRCGKPNCHCHQPGHAGHGPNSRLTHKLNGKTVTESLPTPAAIRKVQREIASFRKFQQLSQQLVEVNGQICRLRPVEEPARTSQEKKRPKRSIRKSRMK